MQAELTVSGVRLQTEAGQTIWMPASEVLDLARWIVKHEVDLQLRAWQAEPTENERSFDKKEE